LKLKLVALTLIAFACWLVPIKVLAQETGTQTHAQSNTQTIPEVHDTSTTQNANADPSERGKENETGVKKEVINEPANVVREPEISSPTAPSIPKRVVPRPAQSSGRNYTVAEVQQLIKDYSSQYGISAEIPLRIANCESGYNQFSKNKNSTASGVFQFLNSTWANQPAGKRGVSVFDADANVQAAVWLLAHGKTSMWVCK
jgi:hypothetical protein